MKSSIATVINHIRLIIAGSRCRSMPFHNEAHTLEVYKITRLISNYEPLAETEMQPILIAALFHDTGYAFTYDDHEQLSAVFAKRFLKGQGFTKDFITLVTNCILATKVPQEPKNKYEAILCDADLYHLGTRLFFKKNRSLRREWADYLHKRFTDRQWHAMNLKFLKAHQYHTSFGRVQLQAVKQGHIDKLEKLFHPTSH